LTALADRVFVIGSRDRPWST